MRATVVDFGSHLSRELLSLVGSFADAVAVPPGFQGDYGDIAVFSGRSMRGPSHNEPAFASFRALKGTPAIGICYGAEAYNLFRGGSLMRSPRPIRGKVTVRFEGAGFVEDSTYELFEARHYVIGRLGEGLRAVAFSEHGVEAYVGPAFVGLMFHPEASGRDGEAILRAAASFLLTR